jgi:hypothetical protein
VVLAAAAKQEAWEVEELESTGEIEIRVGGSKMTSTISEKSDACSILCGFAHELKEVPERLFSPSPHPTISIPLAQAS